MEKLNKIFFSIKGKNYDQKKNISDLLDSIETFQLISEIEKKFKLKLKPKQINEKNFSTLNSILNLLNESKK